jgi:hypothetical protein
MSAIVNLVCTAYNLGVPLEAHVEPSIRQERTQGSICHELANPVQDDIETVLDRCPMHPWTGQRECGGAFRGGDSLSDRPNRCGRHREGSKVPEPAKAGGAPGPHET